LKFSALPGSQSKCISSLKNMDFCNPVAGDAELPCCDRQSLIVARSCGGGSLAPLDSAASSGRDGGKPAG